MSNKNLIGLAAVVGVIFLLSRRANAAAAVAPRKLTTAERAAFLATPIPPGCKVWVPGPTGKGECLERESAFSKLRT